MTLLVRDLMKWTPPISNSDASARQAGERAVETDIKKLFRPLDDENVTGRWVLMFNRTTKRGVTVKEGAGPTLIYDLPEALYQPNISQEKMRQFHQANRGYRGRVKRDLLYNTKVHVSGRALRKYIRETKRHVGRAKSGWLSAIRRWGSLARTVKVPHIPAWVARHGGGEGYAMQIGSRETGQIILQSSNTVPYITQLGMDAKVNACMRTRQADILDGYYIKRVEKWLKSHSAAGA